MSTILVPYATSEGQTARVVDRIADRLREHGHTVELVQIERDPADVSTADYDAVIVACSIHTGRHQPEIVAFAEQQREALSSRPSGFVQVSLSAASDDPERRGEAAGYVEEFFAETGWRADLVGSFAGALRYSEYNFLLRFVMKRIAKSSTGDTDTSRDYEYTDWDAVDAFADDFADLVAERLGVPGDATVATDATPTSAADDTPAASPER
ncbi:flavodoxin domain-containing protein [Salinirubrum litoreum]|uniref:Flavodoxin domain-containing protein n=1 Tax=Salinirubrum litoreum TaxID=1126234 RepID=A0ABD5R8T9_9EURY|nr:flavodoxin domain-containing protein [Salinirubrum litoreum]